MNSIVADVNERLSIADEPSTPKQKRLTTSLIVGIAIACCVVVIYGTRPLPRIDAYVPATQSLIYGFDVITAVILFGQSVILRSRALLVLASGYLCAGLFVLVHTLTFPGAFSETGLFGATSDTAGWLYIVWHSVFPASVIAYLALRHGEVTARPDARRNEMAAGEVWVGAIVAVGLVVASTALLIVAADRLPPFLVGEREFNPLTRVISITNLLLAIVALAMFHGRYRNVLDEWVRVAVVAAAAESVIVVLAAGRYTVAFYSGRIFAIVVSVAVLSALLWQTTRLYSRHAIALRGLQRERANKLLSLGSMVGVMAHEIRQPLNVVSLHSGAVRRLMKEPQIDVDKVRSCLDEVEQAGERVTHTVDSVRALFRNAVEDREEIDVNALVEGATSIMQPILEHRGITVEAGMRGGLPRIVGHAHQLQEVLLNILQNAVDAMETVTDRPRVLSVRTADDDDSIVITIRDSGVGIEPRRMGAIFDALTTTKANGTGFGLGLCKLIVDQHGGELSVRSELGSGTEFRIVLPAKPAAAAASDMAANPAQRRTRKSRPNVLGSA